LKSRSKKNFSRPKFSSLTKSFLKPQSKVTKQGCSLYLNRATFSGTRLFHLSASNFPFPIHKKIKYRPFFLILFTFSFLLGKKIFNNHYPVIILMLSFKLNYKLKYIFFKFDINQIEKAVLKA